MAYRGGRGDHPQQQYGGGRAGAPAGGGRGGGRFPWPPPGASSSSAPRPAVAVHQNPNATGPHQGAYQHGVVFRGPAPPSSAPVTIRAPSPTPATVPAPSSTPSPAAAPYQPARVSAPAPAPPTPASVAKELEQKLFVTETALAPPAAAAAAAHVDQLEAEKAPEVDLAPVSKKGLAHPARPGAGTVGKKVMIRANHFLVNVADNSLFHYDVSINPESKSRAVNREVLSELIKLHGKTSLGGKLPTYDGRKSLYTAGSLPFESEEFSVTLVDPEKKDKERAEREYKITIRIAGRTDLYHLQQFLKGRQTDMPQETIQVLDVVLRESPSWNYVTVSRSFFSTTFGHRGDIGEGLECWRGYYQSLHSTQMGLSLNIDTSATSFFKPVTVVQFVLEFLNLRDASRPLTDRDRVKIKKALRGVRVETNHQEDQIRRYKITGITPVPMSQLIFPVDERGTRMSVVQYFMQRYNYNLQYTTWPCLQSGSDARPVYLPMETCKIVEGQRYSKKLNDKQVTNILGATCQRPQQREQSIREMVLHNKYAEDKFAQEFGINVCSDLVAVPARVLPPPMLRYHDSGKEKTCAPSVGQWNMINKKMINGGIIDNWACVSFSRMLPEEVHRFCCDLIQMCNMTGMSVNPRPIVDNRSANPNHIENALKDVYRRTMEMLDKQGHKKQLQLLIVILPEVGGSYGKIKKVCETDLGIVSQCCLPRHAARPNKQYMENVALKINVKAGGRNIAIEKGFARFGLPAVAKVPTIIFGADVVASMDWPKMTKYKGLVSVQPHRQEIIEDLFCVNKDQERGNINGGMIRELLITFRRRTGRRPERILFYRAGVSEGQLTHVRLHEMDAIRKACLEEGCLPQIIYIATDEIHYRRPVPEVQVKRENFLSGSDSTQDSPFQPELVHISISTLADRLTVDVPSNGACLDIKNAIESKIDASIDNFTLKIGNSIIDYNQTLEFYGIKENPLLRMDPKMRGGADRNQNDPEGSIRRASRKSRKRRRTDKSIPHNLMQAKRPKKRTRKSRSNDKANAQPAMLTTPIQSISLANYASSAKLFRLLDIRDPRISTESQQEVLIDTDGRILGKSLVDIFVNAVQQNLTWNGVLTIDDFCVIAGRVFCLIDPVDPLSATGFQADSYCLAQLIKRIFIGTEEKQLLFMDELISTLENASQSPLADGHVDDDGVLRVRSSWGTYLITHYAFKSIIERGTSTSNIMLYFNDLKSQKDKDQFKKDCNKETSIAFDMHRGEAWDNYMFLPTLDYALRNHNKEYSGRGFKILQFVRDFNTHSPVVPWHLRDLSATLILGTVICRIIKYLLVQGWDIGKALGA